MIKIRSVSVFCGSSRTSPPDHQQAAHQLGTLLATAGLRLIYGGGRMGLMGKVADGALEAGGAVIGVIPAFLEERELANHSCTELVVVPSMHERKQRMFALSEAFVVLPGGLGTLDELTEIMGWKQLRQHAMPIIIVNINGFWEPLRHLMDHLVATDYLKPIHESLITYVSSVEEVLPAITDCR